MSDELVDQGVEVVSDVPANGSDIVVVSDELGEGVGVVQPDAVVDQGVEVAVVPAAGIDTVVEPQKKTRKARQCMTLSEKISKWAEDCTTPHPHQPGKSFKWLVDRPDGDIDGKSVDDASNYVGCTICHCYLQATGKGSNWARFKVKKASSTGKMNVQQHGVNNIKNKLNINNI